MDSSSPLARVDDPHEADAGRQVLPDLVQDLAGPVLGREDLNREIRDKLAEALGSDPARQPPFGHKAHVRRTDVAPRETVSSAGPKDVSQAAWAPAVEQSCDEANHDFLVAASGRTHT